LETAIDTAWAIASPETHWKVHSKDHPVAVTCTVNDTATDCSYTTLLDSTAA
jgi:hypothetical protein